VADADRVEKEVWIDAPPAAVFAFFTDPEKFARWLGVALGLDARPGGELHVDPNGKDRIRGRFLEVVPPARIVFSWGFDPPGPPVPPGSSVVEVTFTPENGGTRVRLVHLDLPGVERDGHSRGWDYHLERLRRVALGLPPGDEPCPND